MTQSDPREMIENARRGGYAVGAYNMHNEETTEALVWAAERADSPIFLQVGRAIIPHVGVRRAYEMTKRIAEKSGAEYAIHLDHGSWDEALEAIKLGFTSIMYDGAHLPFEENIETTRKVVEIAHATAFRWKLSWAKFRTLVNRSTGKTIIQMLKKLAVSLPKQVSTIWRFRSALFTA